MKERSLEGEVVGSEREVVRRRRRKCPTERRDVIYGGVAEQGTHSRCVNFLPFVPCSHVCVCRWRVAVRHVQRMKECVQAWYTPACKKYTQTTKRQGV